MAIIDYFLELPTDAKKTFKPLTKFAIDIGFQKKLNFLQSILLLLDEVIISSESDHSSVCYIVLRQKEAYKGLLKAVHESTRSQVDKSLLQAKLRPIFYTRFKTQISAIYYIAYLVNPTSIPNNQILPFSNNQIWDMAHKFLIAHCEPEETTNQPSLKAKCRDRQGPADRAILDLIAMRKKTGFWSDSNTIQRLSRDIQAFQLRAYDSALELGAIAIRLLSTPTTSVPSERSFSGLNIIISKARNRLRSDRVDKL